LWYDETMNKMPNQEYQRAMELARTIAIEVGQPLFCSERRAEISLSEGLFSVEQMIQDILKIVDDRGDFLGHGPLHVRKVAIDTGAVILTENTENIYDKDVRRLVLLGHVAGLLHDICRREKNHAQRGAEETEKILSDFPLGSEERQAITSAIQNHEAFRPFRTDLSPAARLLSDSLYDADKFRWGPDNFTETVWAMTASRAIPLDDLMLKFPAGMRGIAMIRDSFRTITGKRYGPDFIDRGLEIGRRLHTKLTGA
jgi:hypothetical protein